MRYSGATELILNLSKIIQTKRTAEESAVLFPFSILYIGDKNVTFTKCRLFCDIIYDNKLYIQNEVTR